MNRLPGVFQKHGHKAHYINLRGEIMEHAWSLAAQSKFWPVILGCQFRHNASDSRGRRRVYTREHAVVVWNGMLYDPASPEPIDLEACGHLGDRGIIINSCVIVEPGLEGSNS